MPPLEGDGQRDDRVGALRRGGQEERRYWRSLDRLLDSPAVRAELAAAKQEFPEGADQPPDGVSRRSMLTLMGASFALAGLEGCRRPVETIVPYVNAPEMVVPGRPRYYATALPLGTAAYGVVVESHEGRPTKIEGNELHPSSGGAATAWMQASILDLYDPDRSNGVLHRAAGGGETPASPAAASPATWDDFAAFWQGLAAGLAGNGGAGLAVLVEPHASPTLTRLAAAFRQRFPAARWVVYSPVDDDNVYSGLRRITGTDCRAVYRLEKADKILALDADLLHTESESLAQARGFAAGRRVETPGDGMNRLYAVESTLTLTGAMADERLRMKSGHVPAAAVFVAAALRDAGLAIDVQDPSSDLLTGGERERLTAIARDLAVSPGRAVVVAGRRQRPEVHALALAMNRALGGIGETVRLYPLVDVSPSSTDDFHALVEGLAGGEVRTLVMLGGNPVYNAPADLDFTAALAKAEHTVHLSSHVDETSRRCEWHLPAAHVLEAWGDVRAADGTLSAVQPLIAPLLDGRSAIEVAGLLVHDEARPGHDLVRETWRSILPADRFDGRWHKALHDGVAVEGAVEPLVADLDAAAIANAARQADRAEHDHGIEITFHPCGALFDGRFANNGWLQELPDALTKVTWDNAVLMSPATAASLGVGTHDVVLLTHREKTIEAPVFVLPGQADDSVTAVLGYGRTAAGRVGNGVGYNAYRLRHSEAAWCDGGLVIDPTDRRHDLVQTQEHWSMEGRDIVLEATLAQYREHPHFAQREHGDGDPHQLFPHHDYGGDYQWAMSIDLNACIGCNACVIACQSENNIPIVGPEQVSRGREMHWLRIDRYFVGEDEQDPEVAFQPVACMHCENAPCEEVCPVAATVHDREGLNAMVYNRCIGTRYCSNNCPYKVRRFNFFNYTKDTPELVKIAQNPDVTVRSRGVMEKCTFCLQRISEAKIAAKHENRQVRDGEIRTACQQTCPTGAIVFGNRQDKASRVVAEKGRDRSYDLLGELHNLPRTSYLAKLRNPHDDEDGGHA